MDELKELAVEGVGLTRYAVDYGDVLASEWGDYVLYEDAAARIADLEAKRLFWKERAHEGAEAAVQVAAQLDALRDERDALKAALTTFLAALRVAFSGTATNAQLEAMAGLLAEQLSRGLTQTRDDPPPDSAPHP